MDESSDPVVIDGRSLRSAMSEGKKPEDRPVPEQVRRAAANRRGGWVYEVVGNYAEGDDVPPEAIRGAWKIDDDGRPTGEFIPNARFRAG
jgi:hypothetical protein